MGGGGDRLVERPVLVPGEPPVYEPYRIVPKAFSVAQCRRIVELGGSAPEEPAGVEGAEGAEDDPGLRRSTVAWIPPDDGSRWIYERLARIVQRANRHYRFELTGFAEDLQFTRYDTPGAFYTWHQDGLDGPVGLRKLSVVVQLSDPGDYDGGELELFALAGERDGGDPEGAPTGDAEAWEAASAQQGTAVVFPAFEYHRVRPLRSGTRCSLVSWVSGPPFR